MPTSRQPRHGARGMFMIAPTEGAALVKLTGPRDATITRDRTDAAAHGMDAVHNFDVPGQPSYEISLNRVYDRAQDALFEAIENCDNGGACPFVFYPHGESPYTETETSVSGLCLVKANSAQSLTDPITNPITIRPADDDWEWAGTWTTS